MQNMKFVDLTLRESEGMSGISLGFKEKIEMARQLEKLAVDVVELGPVADDPSDALVKRTLAATIQGSIVSCPVTLEKECIDRTWDALHSAAQPRMNVCVPTSAVQMEYESHLKPAKMLEKVEEAVKYCAEKCADVEFTAQDATRSDKAFLKQVLETAVKAGAKTVTVCDTAGNMMPQEAAAFVADVREAIGEETVLGFYPRNDLGLALANAIAAMEAGAQQIRLTYNGWGTEGGNASLEQLVHALQTRGDLLKASVGINTVHLRRIGSLLNRFTDGSQQSSPFRGSVSAEPVENLELSEKTDAFALRRQVENMGYELSEGDMDSLYHSFVALARKKTVDTRDLEALIADNVQRVAPTYQLTHYVINNVSLVGTTALIQLDKQGIPLQCLCAGDGPIDASFMAIEQMLGRHYEVEDFQLQAVTEGRGAMGTALVKLRWKGRLYSGRGLSTDIIGASISAYINAVNKIASEEKNV